MLETVRVFHASSCTVHGARAAALASACQCAGPSDHGSPDLMQPWPSLAPPSCPLSLSFLLPFPSLFSLLSSLSPFVSLSPPLSLSLCLFSLLFSVSLLLLLLMSHACRQRSGALLHESASFHLVFPRLSVLSVSALVPVVLVSPASVSVPVCPLFW